MALEQPLKAESNNIQINLLPKLFSCIKGAKSLRLYNPALEMPHKREHAFMCLCPVFPELR